MRAFYLQDASAAQMQSTLKTLLKAKDLVVDDKLNLIVMRDTPEAIRLAEKLVALHDQAEPEVMLEMEVLEVQQEALLIRWQSTVQRMGFLVPRWANAVRAGADDENGFDCFALRGSLIVRMASKEARSVRFHEPGGVHWRCRGFLPRTLDASMRGGEWCCLRMLLCSCACPC